MKTHLKILLTLLFLALGFVPSLRASDVVIIDAKYKQGTILATDPEYPLHAQHLQASGQGIYRLIINTKTGLADEVKVLRSTGYRELDASAVMTLFKWKFQPGTVDHCLAIDSLGEMIGYLFGSGQTMGTLTEMEFHRRRFMNRHDKRALL
jgi:TonB family protein